MLGDDEEMKLTLLLQHCKEKAHDLIEDCVMLPPSQGYSKALEKLERRFGPKSSNRALVHRWSHNRKRYQTAQRGGNCTVG